MTIETIFRAGFLIAAAFNIFGILHFSRGMKDDLGKLDPLFDFHGISAILLFGLAYASLWNRFSEAPMVSLVFGVEKMYYAVHYIYWTKKNQALLRQLKTSDPRSASFLNTYGIGDGAFGVFFFVVGIYYHENLFGNVG